MWNRVNGHAGRYHDRCHGCFADYGREMEQLPVLSAGVTGTLGGSVELRTVLLVPVGQKRSLLLRKELLWLVAVAQKFVDVRGIAKAQRYAEQDGKSD